MCGKDIYPFTAIVGQEKMKLGLILNVINPRIGGILIRGQKGTAKSTAVRGLAEILPALDVVKDCRFRCNPEEKTKMCQACLAKAEAESITTVQVKKRVIDLPVSATEDRVVGTLDIEYALKEGKKRFEPGILAEANNNILYVDEVNLLDDHIIDVLLDSAAMGINTVEREGISFSHPAGFILVGTMNPEEGELRPQLLDRFGLAVDIEGISSVEQRVEVIERRLAFEADPVKFCFLWEGEQERLRERIAEAVKILPLVEIGRALKLLIARIAVELGVDGHRADITLMKTACTLAAFDLRTEVREDDLKTAAELALLHRMRRRPFEKSGLDWARLENIMSANAG